MRSKGLAVIGLLVAASMVLAACGTATPETVIQTVVVEGTPMVVEVTAAAPAGPKVVRTELRLAGDVPTIDPGLSTDTSSTTIVNATTIGLSYLNEVDATLHPGMASSWDISEDGLTYTFHLLPGHPVGASGTAPRWRRSSRARMTPAPPRTAS